VVTPLDTVLDSLGVSPGSQCHLSNQREDDGEAGTGRSTADAAVWSPAHNASPLGQHLITIQTQEVGRTDQEPRVGDSHPRLQKQPTLQRQNDALSPA
jgi:hypothetical protein